MEFDGEFEAVSAELLGVLAELLGSPAAGSVPPIYTKGATASYFRAGWPVRGGGVGQAGGGVARRQGEGGRARPCRGAGGERRWGAFSESAAGTCGRLGDRSPTLGTLGEVGMDREDSIPTGRWAARMGREGG